MSEHSSPSFGHNLMDNLATHLNNLMDNQATHLNKLTDNPDTHLNNLTDNQATHNKCPSNLLLLRERRDLIDLKPEMVSSLSKRWIWLN